MNKARFLIALLVLFFHLGYTQSYSEKITALEQYIEKARKDWKVPGLAVAIVKDGKTLLAKGFGEKEVGSSDMVNSQTIFVNASTTKAMTALATGLLVDEGLIDWDDRVIEHMPEFQLADPYVTKELRVRDLFTHNAGLGNADFLWVNSDLSQDEILYQMRYLEPSYPFRGGYQYQNIMYLAAGKLIEKISGKPWSTFMEERVFTPLGMTRTFPYLSIAQQQTNRSSPHAEVNGVIIPIQDTDADAIGPAGSVWSCVTDMAIWMNCLLDSTKFANGRLLKPQTYQELFRPQIVIPFERFYPSKELTKPHWTTYALGWYQHDFQGRFVCFHTGSLAGRVAIHGLIPDEKLGVFVYGNLSGAEARHAIMYKVFDAFGPQTSSIEWSSALQEIYAARNESYDKDWKKVKSKRVKDTKPSKVLANYSGTYYDQYFGKIKVEVREDKLVVIPSSQIKLTLEHWHFDTFLGHYSKAWYSPSFVKFGLSEMGEVNHLKMDGKEYRKIQ